MTYCRICGTEIVFKRTKNDKWMPCNLLTGEKHFCQEDKSNSSQSGLMTCPDCGKPIFPKQKGVSVVFYDYATLGIHECKKADITRYVKYKNRSK